MRVWFNKIRCTSIICFSCKPSQHLYTPPPPTFNLDKQVSDVQGSENGGNKEVDASKMEETELVLKSCIKRKVVDSDCEQRISRKKNVQWMDVAGSKLVDVKEFQTSESEDTDSESEHNRGCSCSII